jgi:3-oxoacyl-[acyl-carrier protein] reductase
LQGKTALVTGAAAGMGRSHAVVLAQRGADVVVHDLSGDGAQETAAAVRAAGRRARVIVMDIRDTEALVDAIHDAAADLGSIDILVNNAGVGGGGLSLEGISEEIFDRVFDIHVKGAFFLTQAVVPAMKQQRYGKIINMTSVFAMGGSAFASHYAAAKSALTGLTKSWARELAPFNIMVNAVAPGVLETGMTLNSIGKDGIRALAEDIPLGRMAKPIDISYAVAWLASPETDMLTGQVISPNGGAAIVGI